MCNWWQLINLPIKIQKAHVHYIHTSTPFITLTEFWIWFSAASESRHIKLLYVSPLVSHLPLRIWKQMYSWEISWLPLPCFIFQKVGGKNKWPHPSLDKFHFVFQKLSIIFLYKWKTKLRAAMAELSSVIYFWCSLWCCWGAVGWGGKQEYCLLDWLTCSVVQSRKKKDCMDCFS